MQIFEKTPGPHVAYRLEGSCIEFHDGELRLDLARYMRDFPVHLIISENAFGMLVTGPAHRYVAELDLPARRYAIEVGAADDIGFPRLYRRPQPLNPDDVTLTLWGMEV